MYIFACIFKPKRLDFLKVFFLNRVHVDAPILYFQKNDSNIIITIKQY